MSLSPHFDVCEGPRFASEPNKVKNNKSKISNLENLQGNISTRDVYRTLSNIYDKSYLAKIVDRFYPVSIYVLIVNNRNTRTRCEICSKLTMKSTERCYPHYSGISIVNLSVSIVNFEHVIAG